jgi:predicted transposase YbfD/YdcC
MARSIPRSNNRRTRDVVFKGVALGAKDFRRIQKLIEGEHKPTRQQIAREVCRMYGFRQASGELSVRACRDLLLGLEAKGLVRLPPLIKRAPKGSLAKPIMGIDFLLGPTPGWMGRVADDADLEVRPVLGDERAGFSAYMRKYHYLGDSPLVGKSLRYGAWLGGELVALLGWSLGTKHNACRERYVGWDDATRRARLHLVVNNARFLILPWVKQHNLASRVLGANLRRLSSDWEAAHGHPVLLAETFVDRARFHGTCYRASNWVSVGQTKGWSRHGQKYEEHGRPKEVLLYPLHKKALQRLRAPLEAPISNEEEAPMEQTLDVTKLPLDGEGGLFSVFSDISDSRKKRGIRHPLQAVLAVASCAVLAGQRSFAALEEWARDQSREVLKLLGCRYGKAPSERTFRRVLKHQVNADELDEKLGLWVAEQQPSLEGAGLSLDGKTLRGSRDGEQKGVHLLSAVVHGSGVVVAQMRVSDKTNEIPCVKPLLADLNIKGAVVTADALHTQTKTARYIVEDKGADYVLTVKDNQPTMREDIERQFDFEQQEAERLSKAKRLDEEAFPP